MSMQHNILWRGREYYSLENCCVKILSTSVEIVSTIVGSYEGRIYKADYRILTNDAWVTSLLEVNARIDGVSQFIVLERDHVGGWQLNGEKTPEFDQCIDVDIPVTPFTNTLPVRRLRLNKHESQEISVIYCDLLSARVEVKRQRYTRLSHREYHYENVPNDFEATIEVDDDGFVVDYPQLFVRKLKTGD